MAFAQGTFWQYKCPFRRAWSNCTDDEDHTLKTAYLKCMQEQEVVYVLNGVRFTANFASMLRINVSSKRKMELRLQGGPLPFPPPKPQLGQQEPSEGSLGKSDGVQDGGVVTLSPEALNHGPNGHIVPHGVRKAWGQGVPPGETMAGFFSFTMDLKDKDYLGEMLTWNMHSAGVTPETLDNKILYFTAKNGERVVGNKDAIQYMLNNPNSYPVRVDYIPAAMVRGMTPEAKPGAESQRVVLKFVQNALKHVDHDIHKVKHTHQRRTYERYQLYLEDHYYQNEDYLEDACNNWEFYMKFPFMTGSFGLIDKSGPNLPRILAGDADILEFLFGG